MNNEIVARKSQLGSILQEKNKYSAQSWVGVTIEEEPVFFDSGNIGKVQYETKEALLVRKKFDVRVELSCSSRDKFEFSVKLNIPFESKKSRNLLGLLEFYFGKGSGLLKKEDMTQDIKSNIRSETSKFVYSNDAEFLQYTQPEEQLRDALMVSLDKFSSQRGVEYTPTRFAAEFWSEGFSEKEKMEKLKERKLEKEEFEKLAFLAETENEIGKVKKIDEKIKELGVEDWYQDYLDQLSSVEKGHPVNASIRTLQKNSSSGAKSFTRDLRGKRTKGLLMAAGNSVLAWYPENRSFNRLVTEEKLDGIRSIRLLDNESEVWLSIGHRKGVYLIDWSGNLEETVELNIPPGEVNRSGFNGMALVSDRLYASNSSSGLYEWELDGGRDEPDKVLPEKTKVNTPAARKVRCIKEDKIGFVSGDEVVFYEVETGDHEVFKNQKTLSRKHQSGLVDFTINENNLEAIDRTGTLTSWSTHDKQSKSKRDLHTGGKVYTLRSVEILKREYYLLGIGEPYCPIYPKDNTSICITSYQSPAADVYFVDGRSDYLFGLDRTGSRLYVWEVDEGGGDPLWVEDIKSKFGHGVNDFAIIDSQSPVKGLF